MKKIILFVFAFSIIFNAYSQDKLDLNAGFPKDPNLRVGTLENGMKYYVRKNAKPENRVELQLVVKVGSTMENDNQQGLAHFCEHMAFNGSKNFLGNQLIQKLEAEGIRFGENLNAYTSFDQTVYMLQVPAEQRVLDMGIQVLEDWAVNLSFDPKEIEKERGVIIEEWRLGQGANERLQKQYWPYLFKGSRYAERLPIGKKEVIESFKHETLIQFYKDWYRTDLMAVVAIGDFDIDKIEKQIKDKFSKIPKQKNPKPLLSFEVPDHKETLVVKATDKEAPYTLVQVYYKHPSEKNEKIADYRRNIVYGLYSGMLNQRLNELTKKANPPFVYAYSYYGNLVKTKDTYASVAMVKENDILIGLEVMSDENEKVKRFGFTQTELDRQKSDVLRNMETSFNERNKNESANYASEYVRNFLNNEPIPGIEFEYEIYKKYVPTITLEEINALPKKFITDGENEVVVIIAPEKENLKLPSDDEIKNAMTKSSEKKLEAYVDNVINKPLIDKMPNPKKIIEEKNIKELNITEWKLENGVKIYYKPTDFKNDEILFSASSVGGYLNYPEKDHLSATNATNVISISGIADFDAIQLQKLLSGKIVNVSPYISDVKEGLRGSAAPQDLETMMQLIYAYFTKPRLDQEAFTSFIQRQKASLENRQANPDVAFYDTISVTMNNYNFRARPVTPELLNEIDMNKAYEIYTDRFADASDFSFYFVGNIKPEEFKPLVEKYIGGLPVKERKDGWKDSGIRTPKGNIEKTVYKGFEPKSTVIMEYTGKFDWNRKNRFFINALNNFVDIKLREAIREDQGGTYGVGAWISPRKYPITQFATYIQFGCDPKRVDELINVSMQVIDNVKKIGATKDELDKVKELLLKERETDSKKNEFWLSAISSNYDNEENILEINLFENWVKALSNEDLMKAAKQYYNKENFAKFILKPEGDK
ncbi:MAG: hypothetical protein A2X12_08460 [Bacteroidetes bacterium GWE2_29_8]|nr:MAG: hypothetical protein A2X12_08460 [Bacteroidetes bacterium GWE2_29_8]OFY22578.1 MAG: hypothetical protein A2X02_02315 [Bacteroidetes bacterium GWF2_29_10]